MKDGRPVIFYPFLILVNHLSKEPAYLTRREKRIDINEITLHSRRVRDLFSVVCLLEKEQKDEEATLDDLLRHGRRHGWDPGG
jgi:hypothetical protein